MLSLKTYIQHPEILGSSILMKFFTWIPDRTYLKMLYRLKTGKRLNFKKPESFNEKLQWLKLYNRKPEYTPMVDKITAKKFAAERIGMQHIIPTYGFWDSPDEIDWDSLPESFILKTSNGGGGSGVVFCTDKSDFDKEAAIGKLKASMKSNIYARLKEWPYKNVKPRILAEKLLKTDDGSALEDYKFFCFDGKVKAVLVSYGRFKGETCFDYFDENFTKFPFRQGGPNSPIIHTKPDNFDKMKELAEKLSDGLPHARIDLYGFNGNIYFGEVTFFDSSGFAKFDPEEWDYKFGQWLKLPNK